MANNTSLGGATVTIGADLSPLMRGLRQAQAAVAGAYIRMATLSAIPFNAVAARGGVAGLAGGAARRLSSALGSISPGGLTAATDAAHTLTRALGRTVQATRGLGSALAALGSGSVLGSIAAIAAGLGFAAKKSSDLEESISKNAVVFGAGAAQINEDVDAMVAKFGVGRRTMLEHAGQIGIAFQGVGIGEKSTAAMTGDMMKRAVDIESLQNIGIDQVMHKLQSGLAGSIRPLREIGVFMTAAMVQQEAYRLGIAKTGGALTEQEKVLARYSLMMRQSTVNVGDAERTHDRFEGQSHEMRGRLENLAAAIGTVVEPAFLSLMAAANRTMKGMTEGFEKGTGRFAGFAAAFKETVRTVIAYYGELGKIAATVRDTIANLVPAGTGEKIAKVFSVVGVLMRNASVVFEIFRVRAGAYIAAVGEVAYAVAGGIGTKFARLGTVLADVFLGAWQAAKFAWDNIVAGFNWAGGQIASGFFAAMAKLMDGLAMIEPFFRKFANALIEGFAKAFDVFRAGLVPIADLAAKLGIISKDTARNFKLSDARNSKLDENASGAGEQARRFRELAGNAATPFQAPKMGAMPDLMADLKKLIESPNMPAEALAAIFKDMEEKTKKLQDQMLANEAKAGPGKKKDDALPKKDAAPDERAKETAKAEFVGIADFARKIQEGALGKDNIPKQQLAEAKKQTDVLTDIGKAVKKPPVAVAAGP